MRPFRPGLRRTLSVLLAAVVSLAILAQPSGSATPPGALPDARARAAQDLSAVATTTVTLKRRKGAVVGDGRTVFVANGTRFRPRSRRVDLPPVVRARSWVVADLDTGRLLGTHRHRARLPQASTIKLLTALTAVRTIGPHRRYRATRYDASQVCSCAGIRRGRVYTRDTLLKGMLLPSGNDAAEAVAGAHPAGRWAFYAEMNRTARDLGAVDTVARNASGLTAAGSHSSARDLLLLLRASVADDTVRTILELRTAVVRPTNGGKGRRVWRTTDYVNRYPSALGKSGWTTPAQNTLVVVTEIGGHRIAVAGLGAPSGYSTSGARALTEWAAANIAGLRPVGRLPHP